MHISVNQLSGQRNHSLMNTHTKVQWALPKTRIPYDFSSYVGRTELDILIFASERKSELFNTALIMKFSSKEKSHDGVLCALHYEFISCKPMILKLKCAMVS